MKSLQKIAFILLFSCLITPIKAQIIGVRDTILMGSRFQITLVDKDYDSIEENINKAIDEIVRIEQLISDWIPTSQVSQINQNAGIQPVKVDREVIDLTKRAIYFSELSNGAFDISFAAMDKIWRFDGEIDQIPSKEMIKKAIEKINYKNIIIDENKSTIFLKEKGMKIGFGSIGKGYAAQKTSKEMLKRGIRAGIINASGDLTTWGTLPDKKPWRIGINNPYNNDQLADILNIKNGASTTSGDYEKFILIEGVRYSHIINPKTGFPSTGLTSVTVIGPNAEICNGFSTSLMVLGKDKGLHLINQQNNYAALLITNQGKIIKSKNYKKVKRAINKL